MKKGNKSRSVIKLISIWIGVLIIVLMLSSLGFSIAAFYQNQRYYSQIVHQKQVERLAFTHRKVEDQIVQIRARQYNLLKDTCVTDLYTSFLYSTVAEQYDMQLNAMKEIFELTTTNAYAGQAMLYIPGVGKKITSEAILPLDQDELKTLLDEAHSQQGLLFLKEGKLMMLETTLSDYRQNSWDIKNIEALLLVELNDQAILEELKSAQLTADDILLLTDSGNRILSGVNQKLVQDDNYEVSDSQTVTWDGQAYTVIRSKSGKVSMNLYWLYIDDLNTNALRQTSKLVYLFIGTIILILFVGAAFLYIRVYQPLNLLLEDAFNQVSSGNLKYRISDPSSPVFRSLYMRFNSMIERLDFLVEKDLRQQLLVSQASFKHLQAQINPHFMYNSYYVLYRMIKMRDIESSGLLCELLGKFFRYITRDADSDKSLHEEVEHARNYTSIQGFRFRNMIQIDFQELPKQYHGIMLPRLVMQPVIENAFKYVFDNVPADGTAQLRVRFEEVEDVLKIHMENSGEITEKQVGQIQKKVFAHIQGQEITGLTNVYFRMNSYFNQDSSMQISSSDLGGLRVTLCIPL